MVSAPALKPRRLTLNHCGGELAKIAGGDLLTIWIRMFGSAGRDFPDSGRQFCRAVGLGSTLLALKLLAFPVLITGNGYVSAFGVTAKLEARTLGAGSPVAAN
ncbi:hypothetical protein BN874_1580027 [Candidatus Contendobacter odensis Run_B_J11]|uniref:Uncharacterized protein n=1 Tax=Candidatus Contendobacter odensis Run_B_J11 TaxID=1400861 RepID=A0A7U7G9K0_9GAMM|nr:hypothetical protein BN874_1580027 [Candidatus Contendobacter odensis Run_B_J11]